MADLCGPLPIAEWFINRVDRDAGEAMTHLKVQKLLYFSQAYFLANFHKPLFEEDFEAWAHGPVLPSVFKEFSGNGWEALPTRDEPPTIPKAVALYLEEVYQKFSVFSAKQLEKISHQHDPWIRARGDLPPEARCNEIIPKDHIEEFYVARIKKAKSKKAK
ncbi:MAG: type II toxin-antitoxin system antitoxin SocA domain-containing protein [Devosia sp.]